MCIILQLAGIGADANWARNGTQELYHLPTKKKNHVEVHTTGFIKRSKYFHTASTYQKKNFSAFKSIQNDILDRILSVRK